MRLVCPNCDAQYEVADAAIPAEGRDVQCSACGHVWFQASPEALAAAAAEAELFDAPAPLATQPPAPVAAAAVAPSAAPVAAAAPGTPPRRSLDENLMAVLREEAEREAEARQKENPRGIETQPDLGLETASPRRVQRSRDVFPDIEEINSTLRPSAEDDGLGAVASDAPPDNRGRSGFRTGFTLMLVAAAAVLALYAMAPKLAEQIPALGPTLKAFTAAVDGFRVMLDGWMRQATAALQRP